MKKKRVGEECWKSFQYFPSKKKKKKKKSTVGDVGIIKRTSLLFFGFLCSSLLCSHGPHLFQKVDMIHVNFSEGRDTIVRQVIFLLKREERMSYFFLIVSLVLF